MGITAKIMCNNIKNGKPSLNHATPHQHAECLATWDVSHLACSLALTLILRAVSPI